MQEVQPSLPTSIGNDTWLPVIMSVVVYPGVGQWMQKRRTSGSVYFIMFTLLAILFTWVLVLYILQVIPFLTDAMEGITVDGRDFPAIKIILQPFCLLLFVYVANVVDVVRGRLQIRHALKHLQGL